MSGADRDPLRLSPDGATRQDAVDVPEAANDGGPAPSPAAAVSLMITKRQKEQLRRLGFSDASIREMTPAEAHGYLGL